LHLVESRALGRSFTASACGGTLEKANSTDAFIDVVVAAGEG